MTERNIYSMSSKKRKKKKSKGFNNAYPLYKSIGGGHASDRDIETLTYILSYRRAANSFSEGTFISRVIKPVADFSDEYGNFYVRIGDAPILWSSHIDTVHAEEGSQSTTLKDGMIALTPRSKSSCLGADCGAGIWLMLEMISAGVEGLYIFHRDEESGRYGSEWIAHNRPDLLLGIQFAIAFDRFGTQSIITHQRGERCCSEEFSKSLSSALGMGHESDMFGSFTDTASYVWLVPECTNLSVGYYDQHTRYECQDVHYLALLRDRLCSADFSKLVCKRDPLKVVKEPRHFTDEPGFFDSLYQKSDFGDGDVEDMAEMIADNPRVVAQLLLDHFGTNVYDMADMIQDQGGTVTFYRRN